MHDNDEKAEARGTWFRELLRGPLRPAGDYFDRLRVVVESSAPVCRTCS